MNTIEKLGEEETFRQIVERSITSFISDELTTLDIHSFYGCKELQEVSLPLVTKLPISVFSKCSKLTAFDFSNVVEINQEAFAYSGLTEVNGPLVTSLAYYAFSSCSNLSKAKLPKVTSIGSYAFYQCSRLSSLIVGTELDDETAICTLDNTQTLPSGIGAIYVPYNLVEKYKTATNWSSFASKIQAYETPVSCQSLTITAEDVPGYKTSTKVHYEAVCTYSTEGMMQTGTKVFKGDAVSDTFGKNPSSNSSRSIEVSYTFLGKTATTTITQSKYIGDSLGGTIFYIDDTADGVYEFYDAEGNVISNVAVGDAPAMYKVLTQGTKDKYYVCDTTLYPNSRWTYYRNGDYVYNNLGTGTAIGTGKTNTDTVMAADSGAYIASDSNGYPTIWYQLQQTRATTGCNDWFIPSKDEMNAVRTAGIISFSGKYIWSSSELSSNRAWRWDDSNWVNYSKSANYSVFFVRAF